MYPAKVHSRLKDDAIRALFFRILEQSSQLLLFKKSVAYLSHAITSDISERRSF